jgi:Cytidine and deoxycytidylate deaminase zinc-binding region
VSSPRYDLTHQTCMDTSDKIPFGLQLARKLWRKKAHRKRVAACYIEGNSITLGTNDFKTDPHARRYGHRYDRTHAELAVLKGITDGSRGKLYVYRERQDGSWGLARPCEFCLKMLQEKNIRRVVYTTPDGVASERFLSRSR